MPKSVSISLVIAAMVLPGTAVRASAAGSNSKIVLRDGWAIQSSEKVQEGGSSLANIQFKPKGWYPAKVPTTVLAALVESGVYPDPYFGMNLRSIPGTEYPIGQNFSNLPMRADSPFRPSWWYRTEFSLPAEFEGRRIWLGFEGINYRANVWLNGRLVADAKKIAGAWRLFELDVTGVAVPGSMNALAVEVFPPEADELAITFVDWSPAPPDKGMGLWRPVYIASSGPVTLRFALVTTRLDLASLDSADLSVTTEVHNARESPVKGTLKGKIGNIRFSQEVALGAGETKSVAFSPEQFPQLRVSHPLLWWPVRLGPQNLHELELEFDLGGKISDRQTVRFGIRQVTSEINEKGYRVFRVNGKKVLIRGAGWSFDMLLRSRPERQDAEVRYVKDLGLNAVRLEGKLEDEYFLNLCDRYGILVLAGWCCCDHWEHWRNWKDEDYLIAAESLKDQIRRLRNHASVFDWLYGSDNPPPPRVEEMYLKILKDYEWPNPYQSSATAKPTTIAGNTGLKMTGPYEYVPPSYWLEDHERGGAFGFNTETGPGPAVPPIESLRAMLPADHLWPIDEFWNFHAGGGEFKNLKVFTEALNARYGAVSSAEDYAMKAQVMAYEGHRAMFEAFGRNKYSSTGVIQWMLNNSWPSMIWHLYDYFLRPGGSYFGAKKACEPLHIQYSYDDQGVSVVNSTFGRFANLKASAKVYNLDLTEKFSKTATLEAGADSSNSLFVLPEIQDLATTYFLKLDLEDSRGKVVSSNFYWLSKKPDVPDWAKSTWYYTPSKSFADLTGLMVLPKVSLSVSSRTTHTAEEGTTSVTVANPTTHLAFFVHLRVTKGQKGAEVLPIIWEDNYFPLMPGEKRTISATYRLADLGEAVPAVALDGWNVLPQ